MSKPVPISSRTRRVDPSRTLEAIEDCADICARARAQGTGMVVFPVSDIELLLRALKWPKP